LLALVFLQGINRNKLHHTKRKAVCKKYFSAYKPVKRLGVGVLVLPILPGKNKSKKQVE